VINTGGYEDKIVYKALVELDEILFNKGIKPFTLNVIGGFALTVSKIRVSDYTDIDYIGSELEEEIKTIVDEVGIKNGLGRGWINNDCLLSDSTSEELEFITGKLAFHHGFDLKVISVNVLDPDCLLRLKVIAVDTAYAEILSGMPFTRAKDFIDIKALMDECNYSYDELVSNTKDYVMNFDIYYLIKYYLKTEDIFVFNDDEQIKRILKNKGSSGE